MSSPTICLKTIAANKCNQGRCLVCFSIKMSAWIPLQRSIPAGGEVLHGLGLVSRALHRPAGVLCTAGTDVMRTSGGSHRRTDWRLGNKRD